MGRRGRGEREREGKREGGFGGGLVGPWLQSIFRPIYYLDITAVHVLV